MKVERKPEEFRPITITIETEEELSTLIRVLFFADKNYVVSSVRHFCQRILRGLKHAD